MKFLPRQADGALSRLLRAFPAVLVVGPRQSGKSTLVRHAVPHFEHVDLERPADYALLSSDVEGFLSTRPRALAIDEAQRIPGIFPALRYFIDKKKGNGRYILTGSASPPLLQTASETLAGRVGLIELAPFSSAELAHTPRAKDRWFWGGYPPVHAARSSGARLEWLSAYVATYLERDLPTLGLSLPAPRLRTLWTMLTHVHGSLLNVSDLARSLSVSSHTVDHYLGVLEWTFMIRRLTPYFANVQKRLTKSPKLYLRDTGLLHHLAGLRSPAQLEAWPKRGASFEGLVIEEVAQLAAERTVRPELHFWRTQAGAEVDLLVVDGRKVVPIEIKLGASVDPRSLAGLRQCMADLGIDRGYVVTTGTERRDIGHGITLVPWADVVSRSETFGIGRGSPRRGDAVRARTKTARGS